MRRCFYHTDLGQNAVFHNFAIQIALVQYSGRSKHAWAFSEIVNKISKITHTTSRFSLLTSAKVRCVSRCLVSLVDHKTLVMKGLMNYIC